MRYIWVILAILLKSGCSSAQQSKEQSQVAAQITKYKNSNPTADLQRAWSKGDFRFIGVYGYSLDAPGVPRGKDKGFIHLVGIKPIERTTDAIQFPAQEQLDEVASRYAAKYNTMLFQRLQASKTTHPVLVRLFSQIEQELKTLEWSNARTDFARNVKKKDFRFIYLYDTGLEGVYDMDLDELKPYQLQTRKLKGNKDLMTKEQYHRLQRVAVKYVRPYNRMLFKHLRSRSKSK